MWIVLDTIIPVSALISGDGYPGRVRAAVKREGITLVKSEFHQAPHSTMHIVHELDETRIAQLHAFFAREWWTSDRSLEETRRCVEGSQIRIGLTDDTGDLIGFARVITDYTFKALVFDVIVADAHRGKGLGDHLVKLVLEHPDLARVRHFELYCLPDVEPFYERHGFSTEVGGVRLMRRDGA